MLERLISLVAPHICLGCGREDDRLLCESCQQELVVTPSRCYKCKAVTDNYMVCRPCRATTPLRQVIVFTSYTGLAKAVVRKMKYEQAQSGARELATLMANHLNCLDGSYTMAAVPTATSRVRVRGYDHAKLITRELSRLTGMPTATLLARVGQAHQVGARRSERLRQLAMAFRPLHNEQIRGQHIVLVDDVVTTGATIEAAARVLRRAGAARVDAIVFAQA